MPLIHSAIDMSQRLQGASSIPLKQEKLKFLRLLDKKYSLLYNIAVFQDEADVDALVEVGGALIALLIDCRRLHYKNFVM